MSFEKPPITPESGEPKISTPEMKNQENLGEKTQERTAEKTAVCLNQENQRFFSKMSEGGKNFANQVYEDLYKLPGVNRVVGKLEIAYNQFWLDRHERKTIELKNKMDGLNLQANTLDQSRKEIESVVETLRQQNMPGVESLQLKLKDVDRQKMGLLNEKDKIQSKFEARENKMKLYANERDRIADKLIGRYNEKLEPMEKELTRLQTHKDLMDLVIAATEVKHKEQIAKLDGVEKEKARVEEALRRTGMSEKEIRKFEAVKMLEGVLAQGREKIKTEKESFAQKRAEINQKIAKVDAEANPYRDKREEFVRVKEGRPLKIEVATRKREMGLKDEEEIEIHTREEKPESLETRKKTSKEKGMETAEETEERLKTSSYISRWNAYLKKKYGESASGGLVQQRDFLRATTLSGSSKLDFKDFKNILGKYYKFRKMPADKLRESIDRFYEEEIKTKK